MVGPEGEPSLITVKARVCHRAPGSAAQCTGMAFHGSSQDDKLVLNYLANTTSASGSRRTGTGNVN